MWRFIIFIVVALYLFYYGTVVMHAFGKINLTNRRLTFCRCFIPFYFWIAPTNEKSKLFIPEDYFDDYFVTSYVVIYGMDIEKQSLCKKYFNEMLAFLKDLDAEEDKNGFLDTVLPTLGCVLRSGDWKGKFNPKEFKRRYDLFYDHLKGKVDDVQAEAAVNTAKFFCTEEVDFSYND